MRLEVISCLESEGPSHWFEEDNNIGTKYMEVRCKRRYHIDRVEGGCFAIYLGY